MRGGIKRQLAAIDGNDGLEHPLMQQQRQTEAFVVGAFTQGGLSTHGLQKALLPHPPSS